VKDKELVFIGLNGPASSWMSFVQGVCARENFLDFMKLRDNLHEEIGL